MNVCVNPIIKSSINTNILINIFKSHYGENADSSSIIHSRFLLGKNAEHNWDIYKASNPADTVFHLDKFPSPYVIINVPIDNLTKEQIYVAALLCKSKSKYKKMANIDILYTSISNTHLGTKSGSFIIDNNHKKLMINV